MPFTPKSSKLWNGVQISINMDTREQRWLMSHVLRILSALIGEKVDLMLALDDQNSF